MSFIQFKISKWSQPRVFSIQSQFSSWRQASILAFSYILLQKYVQQANHALDFLISI